MVRARRSGVTEGHHLHSYRSSRWRCLMRALHVVCSFVLSLLVEGTAIAQIGEPTPVPAPAAKSAEQEPTRPHVKLKPARERGVQASNPQVNATMALKPGVGDDNQD